MHHFEGDKGRNLHTYKVRENEGWVGRRRVRCEKEPGEKPGEVYADRMKLMGKDARGILKKGPVGLRDWRCGSGWNFVSKWPCNWTYALLCLMWPAEKEDFLIRKWELFFHIFLVITHQSWDLVWSSSQRSCLEVGAFNLLSLKSTYHQDDAGEHVAMESRSSHFGSFDIKQVMYAWNVRKSCFF